MGPGRLLLALLFLHAAAHAQTGLISTIVGNGLHFPYAPGVPGTASAMDWPSALAVDSAGALYFAELHTNRIGKLVNGALSTVAGSGSTADLNKPAGIAFDSG